MEKTMKCECGSHSFLVTVGLNEFGEVIRLNCTECKIPRVLMPQPRVKSVEVVFAEIRGTETED